MSDIFEILMYFGVGYFVSMLLCYSYNLVIVNDKTSPYQEFTKPLKSDNKIIVTDSEIKFTPLYSNKTWKNLEQEIKSKPFGIITTTSDAGPK